uniref:Uncharacterized protein n=1 Tax=Anguilla anguilla TaxID=7936 RepID=A0A0E9PVV1_ANGAN
MVKKYSRVKPKNHGIGLIIKTKEIGFPLNTISPKYRVLSIKCLAE